MDVGLFLNLILFASEKIKNVIFWASTDHLHISDAYVAESPAEFSHWGPEMLDN